MDKENDISGSLDCVFKVPMDPNNIKSQEQFFYILWGQLFELIN